MQTVQKRDDFILFHLAFPVTNILDTKRFYGEGLGCDIGRESPQSVILSLYGHQLVAHVMAKLTDPQQGIYPRHFGLVFSALADWQALVDRAAAQQLTFYQTPKLRFPGLPLAHHTVFLADPFDNLLEFKHYLHPEAIFGAHTYNQIGDPDSLEVVR
ncbi:MAG: glyoxalase [Acaryochloridaceae cyanobacterium SU_2_1]|nr:glyoxalase [Acaryochloridaceae cyanobacterium SU_2_1]